MPHSFTLDDIRADRLEDTEARIESLRVKYQAAGLVLHLHPEDLRSGYPPNSTEITSYRLPSPRTTRICRSVVIYLSDGRRWLDKAPENGHRFLEPEED